MEIFIIFAVFVLCAEVLLFCVYRKLKRELSELKLRQRDDFADMCKAFDEQQSRMDEINEEWGSLRANEETAELQRSADRQAALYTQGINNILGYGGKMGAE